MWGYEDMWVERWDNQFTILKLVSDKSTYYMGIILIGTIVWKLVFKILP